MEYRSRTFRIDDEVWAAIQQHELSANKLLRLALRLDRPQITEFPDIDMRDYLQRGKAMTETVRRGMRQKGDGKR